MTSEPLAMSNVTQDSVCVLYAPDSGEIAFVHRITTLGDVATLSDDELEADARASMQLTMQQFDDRPPEGLRMLLVAPDALQAGRLYAVDPDTVTLVERSGKDTSA